MEEIAEMLRKVKPELELSEEDYNQSLVYGGGLDSFDIVTLIAAIDNTFHITIPVKEMVPENFDSIELIWKLVCEVKGENNDSN